MRIFDAFAFTKRQFSSQTCRRIFFRPLLKEEGETFICIVHKMLLLCSPKVLNVQHASLDLLNLGTAVVRRWVYSVPKGTSP
jgi:hypothetical protein